MPNTPQPIGQVEFMNSDSLQEMRADMREIKEESRKMSTNIATIMERLLSMKDREAEYTAKLLHVETSVNDVTTRVTKLETEAASAKQSRNLTLASLASLSVFIAWILSHMSWKN